MIESRIHPRNPNVWHQKIDTWKKRFLFKTIIFRLGYPSSEKDQIISWPAKMGHGFNPRGWETSHEQCSETFCYLPWNPDWYFGDPYKRRFFQKGHISFEPLKKRPYFPWNTACLIGILIIVYEIMNPHITESYNPLDAATNQAFDDCSHTSEVLRGKWSRKISGQFPDMSQQSLGQDIRRLEIPKK